MVSPNYNVDINRKHRTKQTSGESCVEVIREGVQNLIGAGAVAGGNAVIETFLEVPMLLVGGGGSQTGEDLGMV